MVLCCYRKMKLTRNRIGFYWFLAGTWWTGCYLRIAIWSNQLRHQGRLWWNVSMDWPLRSIHYMQWPFNARGHGTLDRIVVVRIREENFCRCALHVSHISSG
jgi:hypothetical protein